MWVSSVSISSYMALFSYWNRQISMTKWCNMASEKQHMGCGYLWLVSRDHVDIVSRSWSSQQNQASYNTLLYILGWSVDWDRKKYGKSQWSHRMQKGRPVFAAYIWHLHQMWSNVSKRASYILQLYLSEMPWVLANINCDNSLYMLRIIFHVKRLWKMFL